MRWIGWVSLVTIGLCGACAPKHATRMRAELTAAMPTPLSPLHFPFASAHVAVRDRAQLQQHIAWLQRHPSAVVILQGHADAIGSAARNLALGDRRARAVAEALMQGGVAATRITGVVSHGEAHPVRVGSSRAARAANRRVEILTW